MYWKKMDLIQTFSNKIEYIISSEPIKKVFHSINQICHIKMCGGKVV
jgi:hypothetical protein